MSLRNVAAGMLLTATIVSSAQAQNAPMGGNVRDGLWYSAGVAGGWTRLSCAICRTDRNAGPALSLGVGTTLRPGLLAGVELDGWTRSHDDVRTLLAAGGVSAQFHPDPDGGLHLRAGLRYVRYRMDDGGIRADLAGLTFGAGYEIPLSGRYSVVNTAALTASSFGALRSDRGTVASDVSISLLQVGVALRRR